MTTESIPNPQFSNKKKRNIGLPEEKKEPFTFTICTIFDQGHLGGFFFFIMIWKE